jgi:outer membrane protein
LLCLFFPTTVLACSDDENCIEKRSWHIGIAFGVGVKTNPLVDGDHIPLVILPDVAWYAERAYFDNGELGYQWLNKSKFAFETFIQLDRESAFFSFLHPVNILVPAESISPASPDSPLTPDVITADMQDNQRSLSINEIASRKWAIHGGIRGHYFLSNGELQLSFQQDVSNVHKGQQLNLEYTHWWLWNKLLLGLRIGTDWKSTRLIDYYYGVSQRDTKLTEFYFSGQSGWQNYVSINAQKPITENWSWLANLGYRKLPDSLTNSPLIEQDNIRNVFLGVAYRF